MAKVQCSWGCGREVEARSARQVLGCGQGECLVKHNEAAEAYRLEVSARRSAGQRNRQPRKAQPLYGDYAQLAKFHGIATDGTGRKAAR